MLKILYFKQEGVLSTQLNALFPLVLQPLSPTLHKISNNNKSSIAYFLKSYPIKSYKNCTPILPVIKFALLDLKSIPINKQTYQGYTHIFGVDYERRSQQRLNTVCIRLLFAENFNWDLQIIGSQKRGIQCGFHWALEERLKGASAI